MPLHTAPVYVCAALFLLGGCSRSTAHEPAPEAAPFQAPAVEVRPDFARYFEAHGAEGAFVLYDLNRNAYIRYNPERCRQRFIPASTFKIFNSLVALETGVVADTHAVIPWDGVDRGSAGWNQDQNLATAFRRSAVWFYQELARRVGAERMQHYVEREAYGNADISGGIDTFWLTGGLRVSPDEQVDFLRKLYEGTLSFSPRSMALVKEIMVMERAEDAVLSGKTGWARPSDTALHLGWLVGYLERAGNVYFFATNLESQDPDFDMWTARHAVTYGILAELGLR